MNRFDFWYYVQSVLGPYPVLYFKVFARRYPFSAMKVTPDTEICIEGFPRSANSYAVVAFRLANPEVKIAHHLHVPAQLLRAVEWGIPALLLIRDPLEAVASFMVFQHSNDVDLYLKAYIRFYRALDKIRPHLVVVDFKTVIREFNTCILQVNQKFARHFALLQNQSAQEPEIFRKLKKVNDQFFRGEWHKSMYPDQSRKQYKERARKLIEKSRFYGEAKQYYELFSSAALGDRFESDQFKKN